NIAHLGPALDGHHRFDRRAGVDDVERLALGGRRVVEDGRRGDGTIVQRVRHSRASQGSACQRRASEGAKQACPHAYCTVAGWAPLARACASATRCWYTASKLTGEIGRASCRERV